VEAWRQVTHTLRREQTIHFCTFQDFVFDGFEAFLTERDFGISSPSRRSFSASPVT